MNSILHVFQNKVLISAVAAWCVAQLIKTVIQWIQEGRFDWETLTAPGGMPSGHSATMTALSVACGFECGWGSAIFAVSTAIAMVVMYDASGIRRAAGKHAAVLNKIIENLTHGEPSRRKEFTQEALRELLGHTPLQVAAGALLGVATALLIGLL